MPALRRAAYLLAAPLSLVHCAPDHRGDVEARPPPAGTVADPTPSPPRDTVLEQTPPPRDEPPVVCALGCPAPFRLELESRTPWPPATYFVRVELDGGGPQVCSVVFEPVLGAAHDDCRAAGLPFGVAYRHDTEAQRIDAVEIWSVQHEVHVELLTSEAAPRLVDVRHELLWQAPSGCVSCQSAAPLRTSVLETWAAPSDAGVDAAANGADGAVSTGSSPP